MQKWIGVEYSGKRKSRAKKRKTTGFPRFQTSKMEAYLEYDPDTFRGKVSVLQAATIRSESSFFRYFVLNFKRLGLKAAHHDQL